VCPPRAPCTVPWTSATGIGAGETSAARKFQVGRARVVCAVVVCAVEELSEDLVEPALEHGDG
jgi:hypothetical protein